jgi:hypothetical protein
MATETRRVIDPDELATLSIVDIVGTCIADDNGSDM